MGVIDLLVVVAACLFVLLGYLRFSEPYRATTSSPDGEWLRVELCVTQNYLWLIDHPVAGLSQQDSRTGQTVAELLNVREDSDGTIRVDARLRIERAGDGRSVYLGQTILPGAPFRMTTPEIFFEAVVCRIEEVDG